MIETICIIIVLFCAYIFILDKLHEVESYIREEEEQAIKKAIDEFNDKRGVNPLIDP